MCFFLSILKKKNGWTIFLETEQQTRQYFFLPKDFPTLWFHDTIMKIVHNFSFDHVYTLSKMQSSF